MHATDWYTSDLIEIACAAIADRANVTNIETQENNLDKDKHFTCIAIFARQDQCAYDSISGARRDTQTKAITKTQRDHALLHN